MLNLLGRGPAFPRNPKAAGAILQKYSTNGNKVDLAELSVLVGAADARSIRDYSDTTDALMRLPAARRPDLAGDLFTVNQSAAVYLGQSLLKSGNLYDGPVDGLVSPKLMKALRKACQSGDNRLPCGSPLLSGDTFRHLAAPSS
jgi:hypothetical protein